MRCFCKMLVRSRMLTTDSFRKTSDAANPLFRTSIHTPFGLAPSFDLVRPGSCGREARCTWIGCSFHNHEAETLINECSDDLMLPVVLFLSAFWTAGAPDASVVSVCGSCSQLVSSVKLLNANEITDRADRQQATGDQLSASKTMCGGICSGQLLLQAGAFSNLGVLLKEQSLLTAAMSCYRTAQRLQPNVAGHSYRM